MVSLIGRWVIDLIRGKRGHGPAWDSDRSDGAVSEPRHREARDGALAGRVTMVDLVLNVLG